MNQDEAQMLTQFKAMEADAEILSVVPREGGFPGRSRCSGCMLTP